VTAAATDPIRSYKLRRGRITDGQRRALGQLWDAYGLDVGAGFDQLAEFGRTAPLILDVGFGMGETTVAMAAADPGRDVIAVDVHTPGAGALLREVHDGGLRNVRVVVADVRDVLGQLVQPGSLTEIRVYFPDPWPKAKHRKRRLVDATFVELSAIALRRGGVLHLATDWEPYATAMLAHVQAEQLLSVDQTCGDRPVLRPVTRFERQGLAKGHQVTDIVCRRV
jgi:tRNA (guanine-N7-)-methyltransferase